MGLFFQSTNNCYQLNRYLEITVQEVKYTYNSMNQGPSYYLYHASPNGYYYYKTHYLTHTNYQIFENSCVLQEYFPIILM